MQRVNAAPLTSPFVVSWIGQARDLDRRCQDPKQRAGAWAQWALTALDVTSHSSSREYFALRLPGTFYDPRGKLRHTFPHLEIPGSVARSADPSFPARLASAGNGVSFPSWLLPEVLALKRSLFAGAGSDCSQVVDVFGSAAASLMVSFRSARSALADVWPAVESALVEDPGSLVDPVTSGFSSEQVAAVFPALAQFDTVVTFDAKLAQVSGQWAPRRVGVFSVSGACDGAAFSLPVIGGRLTRSSVFSDPLFDPRTESLQVLLVRTLLFSRLAGVVPAPVACDPVPVRAGFKVVPVRADQRMPQASLAAAVKFVQVFPQSSAAWEALTRWAGGRALTHGAALELTVTRDGFTAAHRAVSGAVARLADPRRDDVNVLLPLAWETGARVVRVTYVHG